MVKDQLRKPSLRMTQILADNVRGYRKVQNLSQEALADICDLHRTYIGSVERCERNVTLSTLEVIAQALGISVPELLTENMKTNNDGVNKYVEAIKQSGLSIYDPIKIGDPNLWIPTPELEILLNDELIRISLANLPLRTRSKVLKEHICQILGYPVPSSFRKTQLRFPGQFFDTYIQKSSNLQIWNEEIASTRRYVIVRLNADDIISRVKVITGDVLAILDTTGTLTQKYQARLNLGQSETELIAEEDTKILQSLVCADFNIAPFESPINHPAAGQLLPIRKIFEQLIKLIGTSFADTGYDQDRNRGAELHRIVCQNLGYKKYQDDGQFPDIRHQLIEIKLQTSPTIDLGLVCPDSTEPLDIPQIRHCDVRYALFYAQTNGETVTLTHLFLTTGEKFFHRFPQCKGKTLNKKLQIPLPRDFFSN